MRDSAVFFPAVAAGVAVVAAAAVGFVRWYAHRKALLDQPNLRSSHALPVPRLGGAGFMPVVLLAIGALAPWAAVPELLLLAFLGGAVVLFGVGLADDFVSVSTGLRFALHFVVGGALLWAAARHWPAATEGALRPWFHPGAAAYWLLVFWIVGLLNIYNFMDGIDGIAGLQAVVAGAAWGAGGLALHAPVAALIGVALAAGGAGFLVWNWPPAKIFMGDAGSTVLGFAFAGLPLLLAVETRGAVEFERVLAASALVVWPFLADGSFTILRRLRHGENIFQAHRSHLYQRLVIAGVPHRRVTTIYGLLAVGGGFLAWRVVAVGPLMILVAAAVTGAVFVALWRWVIRCERRRRVGR